MITIWRCGYCGKEEEVWSEGPQIPKGWAWQPYRSWRVELKGTPAEHGKALGCSPEHAMLAAQKWGDPG